MRLTGNTILITGGGSGIGRGLAEAFHARGNKVIIAGRRRAALDTVVDANPGMVAYELDVQDAGSIARVSANIIARHPDLNVLVNNAGLMVMDDAANAPDDNIATVQIETNLLGPIRMSAAFIAHLKTRPDATIIYNTSSLAFTPLATFATYSATKAALHSYALSKRFMLRDTSVRVQEIAPPYVGTDLLGNPDDPLAMPLSAFIPQTMSGLGSDALEVVVPEAMSLRRNAGPDEHAFVDIFNTQMAAL